MRSHPLSKKSTVKVRICLWLVCLWSIIQLLLMFTSTDPVAKVASDGIYIILNEVPDLLNSKSHSIIKVGRGSHDL